MIFWKTFRYYEKQRINLQYIKEPFINVNYSGESTNDIIKQRQAEGIALARKTFRKTTGTNYRAIH